jgi:hypothetical protein
MTGLRYQVLMKRRVLRGLRYLPPIVQHKLALLLEDLRDMGPILPHWPNYSKLGAGKYHCHLGYSWVACWTHEKGTVTIEVYYVGSRQNAPY